MVSQVARNTKIINSDTENAKYVINIRQVLNPVKMILPMILSVLTHLFIKIVYLNHDRLPNL